MFPNCNRHVIFGRKVISISRTLWRHRAMARPPQPLPHAGQAWFWLATIIFIFYNIYSLCFAWQTRTITKQKSTPKQKSTSSRARPGTPPPQPKYLSPQHAKHKCTNIRAAFCHSPRPTPAPSGHPLLKKGAVFASFKAQGQHIFFLIAPFFRRGCPEGAGVGPMSLS